MRLRRDSGLTNAEIVELIAKNWKLEVEMFIILALDVHSTVHKRDIYLNQTNQK